MELTQLIRFHTIASSNNISKAAEELCITESTLSKSLRNFEAEIGVLLFHHQKNKVSLNETGLAVLEYVDKVLASVNELESFLETVKPKPTLTIYFENTNLQRLFIPAFESLSDRYHFNYSLFQLPSFAQQFEEYPGGFYVGSFYRHEATYSIPLFIDNLVIRIPKGHILFNRYQIFMQDLDGTSFLILATNDSDLSFYQNLQKKNGIHLDLHIVRDYFTYQKLLNSSPYLSFCMEHAAFNKTYDSNVVYQKITDTTLSRTIYFTFAKELRQCSFIQCFENHSIYCDFFQIVERNL